MFMSGSWIHGRRAANGGSTATDLTVMPVPGMAAGKVAGFPLVISFNV
jgi:ABC-type glycerol-3-phosphate transport system substrate-binding protein